MFADTIQYAELEGGVEDCRQKNTKRRAGEKGKSDSLISLKGYVLNKCVEIYTALVNGGKKEV